MTAPHLRHGLRYVVCLVLAIPIVAFAQRTGTPVTVGPLTVTAPAGWGGQGTNPVQIYSPDSNPQQYLRVEVFAPQETQQDVRAQHAMMLGRMSALIPQGSPRQDGVTGQFIWTRYMFQLAGNQPEAAIWYSAKRGSQYFAITVEATQPELLTRHLPEIESMVGGARFSDAASAPAAAAPPANAGNMAGPQSNAGGPGTLADYTFVTPPGWTAMQDQTGIVLGSPVSVTNEKCFITFFPMRPPGPNLIADANNAFGQVWGQYELRNRDGRGGDMPPVIIRGTSGQGWDYLIVKRGIGPRGSPETRLGFVFAARLNDRLAVISGLSKDSLVSTCMGELAGNVWPRFFYNLSFKNWTPTDQAAAMRRKIAGVWIGGGATAADRMVFGANGRYGGASASAQYTGVGRDVLMTTTAFFGDGAYTLRGNNITLAPDNKSRPTDHGFIRLEEESKNEGATWTEVLYLTRTSIVDGKEYEMRYQRSR